MASKTKQDDRSKSKAAASKRVPRRTQLYELSFKLADLENFTIRTERDRETNDVNVACSIVVREPTPMPTGTGTSY